LVEQRPPAVTRTAVLLAGSAWLRKMLPLQVLLLFLLKAPFVRVGLLPSLQHRLVPLERALSEWVCSGRVVRVACLRKPSHPILLLVLLPKHRRPLQIRNVPSVLSVKVDSGWVLSARLPGLLRKGRAVELLRQVPAALLRLADSLSRFSAAGIWRHPSKVRLQRRALLREAGSSLRQAALARWPTAGPTHRRVRNHRDMGNSARVSLLQMADDSQFKSADPSLLESMELSRCRFGLTFVSRGADMASLSVSPRFSGPPGNSESTASPNSDLGQESHASPISLCHDASDVSDRFSIADSLSSLAHGSCSENG
jgi:hypothetical protein